MKYQIMNQSIPQASRQELNDKILYLIDNDLAESSGITREDIYNAYTGDGGLHGLKYSDFDSYYEYSSAKKEIENGQFFTPAKVCKFIMDCLNPGDTEWAAFSILLRWKATCMGASWISRRIRWRDISIPR